MAEVAQPQEAAPRKSSKFPMMIGFFLCAVLGAGGFYAVYSGLLFSAGEADPSSASGTDTEIQDIAFVSVEPLVISIGDRTTQRHLKFSSALEVTRQSEEEVSVLLPRILDVMNGYLRAVDPKDLEDASALVRLRAQLLRRIQLVTGQGRVRDLLVTEFVLD